MKLLRQQSTIESSRLDEIADRMTGDVTATNQRIESLKAELAEKEDAEVSSTR